MEILYFEICLVMLLIFLGTLCSVLGRRGSIDEEVPRKDSVIYQGKTQFISPVSDKEKFDNAEVVDDMLENK